MQQRVMAHVVAPRLAADLDAAIDSALRWSRRQQRPEGYWAARLQSNACMEAQWLLALHVLGRRDHPLVPRLLNALRAEQRDDGSWEVYHQAPNGDINTTVECYAALKAYGADPDEPAMLRARTWIHGKGGLRDIRVFTRYWLALIGVWPWRDTPNLPPEIIFCPRFLPFWIYNFATWARATLLPISLLSARRPVHPLPGADRLEELFPEGRERFDFRLPRAGKLMSWERFFLAVDGLMHRLQDAKLMLLRPWAQRSAVEWIVRHQDADGVWGGIQPPWVYSVMALAHEGYGLEHPVMQAALGALEDPRWRIDEGEQSYVAASVSPVWDTVLTLFAFQDCGIEGEDPQVQRAIDWLLDQQVMVPGDWSIKAPDLRPGGWAFEYENWAYPDVDDTAVAIAVLARARGDRPDPRIERALAAAVAWTRGMQCSNGGWAAFDKDNDNAFLTKIPFCDFGEVLDPPSVDVTSHVLEAFSLLGHDASDPAVAAGLSFIRREQEADGSWFGRWGVNHVYGVGAVLPALRAVGQNMAADWVQRALDWTLSKQNADGGWGERCGSYMDAKARGRGPSTASQTGWALMALEAGRRPRDQDAVRRGLRYLAKTQGSDGSWNEPSYTGTGFPGYGVGLRVELREELQDELSQGTELSRAFMINYHMYRHYFPLMAMARARAWSKEEDGFSES